MRPQVIAVIGACAPERHNYARRIADQHWAPLVSAQHMEQDDVDAASVIQHARQWMDAETVILEYPLQNPALHIIGSLLTLSPAAFDHQYSAEDEPLAIGQDLALIGVNLDTGKIARAFDAAALTDQELTAGPALWSTFTDPFPEWSTADW